MRALPRALACLASLLLLFPGSTGAKPDAAPTRISSAQCLAWGDFDGNGAPDLVVLSHHFMDSLYLLLNQDGQLRRPSGSLCPGLQSYARSTTRAVCCENEDGFPDLVLEAAGKRILFRNLGIRGNPEAGEWLGLREAAPAKAGSNLAQPSR